MQYRVTNVLAQNENIFNRTSQTSRRKKIYFTCSDKRFSDNNTDNDEVIGRCERNFAKEHLTERRKYYESEKSSRFYQASSRFNILCIRQSIDLFAVNIYYTPSKPIGKYGKSHISKEGKSKYWAKKALEKFSQTLDICETQYSRMNQMKFVEDSL